MAATLCGNWRFGLILHGLIVLDFTCGFLLGDLWAKVLSQMFPLCHMAEIYDD